MNKIGINKEMADNLANMLNDLLANYQVFYTNFRGFHWNIKGDKFFELHAKFEELYDDLNIKVDEIAERILTLGFEPDHSFTNYLQQSEIKEAVRTSDGTENVESIVNSFSLLIAKQRQILDVSAEAEQILENSQIAKLIMFSCKVAIIGPPNTGKSTLLNLLAGRQKAIVTDIKGTTRDWVSAQCRIEPLYLELFDTAGLDKKPEDVIERESQQKSIEILQQADLVLLVLDISQTAEQLDKSLLGKR